MTAGGRGSKCIGLGYRAEAAIMGVAQELLQRVEKSMLGTMVLDGVWVEVLGAVHDDVMLVCAAEAERAAEAVREAESVAEAAMHGSINRFSVFRGFVDIHGQTISMRLRGSHI